MNNDIEQLKEENRLLKESNKFIAEAMPQKVWTADSQGNVDYFNRHWMNFTGRSFEDLREWGWSDIIHPDDLDENISLWKHSIKTATDFQFENRFKRFDGEFRWHLSRGIPQKDVKGNVTMWVGTNTEIHEQKMLQEQLLKSKKELELERNKLIDLFMNAPATICVFRGPEHIIELSNPDHQNLYNNRNLIGKPIREALPELEGQPFFGLLDNVYKTGKPFIGKEVPASIDRESNGILKDVYFNFIYQPFFGINNQVEGVSVFAFDITEQVISRKKAEKMVEELIKANEQLQQFAYIASHDLKEPIRTVVRYVQLLHKRLKEKLDIDEIDYINMVIDAAKRMENLINDLLNYSKLGLEENNFNITDLNKILETVLINLKSSVESSDTRLNYAPLPSLKVISGQMIQLFQNLISNAIKYRNYSITPVINISAEKKRNEWLFSISDNGIGIDPEYFNKIFQIFQRLHGKDEFEGTGIGLAICKKIIEGHGGKIWVESQQGKGTSFFFTLPL